MALSNYVLGLQHIGIPTSNLQRSSDFFQSLGFQIVQKEQIPNSERRVEFLQCKDVVVEVYEEEGMVQPREIGAVDHIAFDVQSIEEAFEQAKASKLHLLQNEIQFLPFGEHGVQYFSVLGPDNVVVEYNQKLQG